MRVLLSTSLVVAACSSAAAPPASALPSHGVTRVELSPTMGQACPDLTRFAAALQAAPDLRADDPQVTGWSYSPWCSGTLELDGVPQQVELFLGGMVRLTDPAGQRRLRLVQ